MKKAFCSDWTISKIILKSFITIRSELYVWNFEYNISLEGYFHEVYSFGVFQQFVIKMAKLKLEK